MKISRPAITALTALGILGVAGCAPAASGAVLAAAPAHATKPTLRQVSLKVQRWAGVPATARLVIARSDHRSVKSLRICIQQRDTHPRVVFTAACGRLDAHGVFDTALFQGRSSTAASSSNQFQWRAYHPAGGGFGAWAGAWSNGN